MRQIRQLEVESVKGILKINAQLPSVSWLGEAEGACKVLCCRSAFSCQAARREKPKPALSGLNQLPHASLHYDIKVGKKTAVLLQDTYTHAYKNRNTCVDISFRILKAFRQGQRSDLQKRLQKFNSNSTRRWELNGILMRLFPKLTTVLVEGRSKGKGANPIKTLIVNRWKGVGTRGEKQQQISP